MSDQYTRCTVVNPGQGLPSQSLSCEPPAPYEVIGFRNVFESKMDKRRILHNEEFEDFYELYSSPNSIR